MSNNETPAPLAPELVQKIIEAQVRLRELGGHNTIIDPKSEAEVTGLKRFLGEVLTTHSSELIGCWVAVHQEYEPLIQTLERIFNRVSKINEQRRAAQVGSVQQ